MKAQNFHYMKPKPVFLHIMGRDRITYLIPCRVLYNSFSKERNIFLHGEGPRSICYGGTTALRLFVQPYDEDEQFFLPSFTSNGAPVE
jgi:hypothetical protein